MIPVLLAVLAVTDAAFAGFRSAAGRNPSVHKVEYFLRALWIGAGVGIAGIAVVAFFIGACVWLDPASAKLYAAFVTAGERMVQVYAVYATFVLLALAVWTLPIAEHRTLSNVLVLGPFTLLRPWVIVLGAAWALLASDDWRVRAGVTLAATAQLATAVILDRIHARAQRRLLARLYRPAGDLDSVD